MFLKLEIFRKKSPLPPNKPQKNNPNSGEDDKEQVTGEKGREREAPSVGTVSGRGGARPGPAATAVPSSKCLAGETSGMLEVVQVSEVTDLDASQFHVHHSPEGKSGR